MLGIDQKRRIGLGNETDEMTTTSDVEDSNEKSDDNDIVIPLRNQLFSDLLNYNFTRKDT